MICCNPRKGLNYYFEMPYFKGFRIEIENIGTSDASIYYRIDCEEKEISPDSLYFHAQFRRINPLPYKQVYTILDSIGDQGQYVGTYLHWGAKSNGRLGEGEVKFFIDGDTYFPSICGTGTEYFSAARTILMSTANTPNFRRPIPVLQRCAAPTILTFHKNILVCTAGISPSRFILRKICV